MRASAKHQVPVWECHMQVRQCNGSNTWPEVPDQAEVQKYVFGLAQLQEKLYPSTERPNSVLQCHFLSSVGTASGGRVLHGSFAFCISFQRLIPLPLNVIVVIWKKEKKKIYFMVFPS